MWQPPASPPCGVTQQALCKIAYAEAGASAACTPQPLRVLRAVVCRPCGVLALWHISGAAHRVLVSGFAVHLVLAPAHPWGLLASQHRPRGLPVRPPRGLPQNRAKNNTRLSRAELNLALRQTTRRKFTPPNGGCRVGVFSGLLEGTQSTKGEYNEYILGDTKPRRVVGLGHKADRHG